MPEDKWKTQLSKWQCKVQENNPLLCDIGIQILTGIIAGSIAGCIVTKWAGNNLPPNPQATYTKEAAKTYRLIIDNKGIFPADINMPIASSDTVTVTPLFEADKKYLTISGTPDKPIVEIKNLPRNMPITVNIVGSDNVTIPGATQNNWQDLSINNK